VNNSQALELIEEAQRDTPLCPCGLHTVAVGRGSAVWLICFSLLRPKGVLRRLLTLDLPIAHTGRLILDLGVVEPVPGPGGGTFYPVPLPPPVQDPVRARPAA
jgi:hypothetical protein